MDVTPDLHMLQERRFGQTLRWPLALGELIDNAFDANAMRVVIEFANRRVMVSDDGNGIADLAALFRMGGHRAGRYTRLGVHGVGFKDAWLWIGDRVNVVTNTGKGGQQLDVSVTDFRMENGAWILPDPVAIDCLPGTTIVFPSMRTDRQTPRDQTFNELELTFLPALQAGKQIVIKAGRTRNSLRVLKDPEFNKVVSEGFEVNGYPVRIRIGIIADGGKPIHQDFRFVFGHRVIRTSSQGSGEYSVRRVTGEVVLGPGWKLSRNKNEITSNWDSLGDAIYSRIKWLLQEAEQLTEDIQSKSLQTEIESMLDTALKNKRKEKRNSQENGTGTVVPRATGIRRKQASQVHPIEGDVIPKHRERRGAIKLDWYDDSDDVKIGYADVLSDTVKLNLSHPMIAAAKRDEDTRFLYTIVLMLYIHEYNQTDHTGQKLLLDRTDFVHCLSELLIEMGDLPAAKGVA